MGELTKNTHKSLAILNDGETILERQIRILSECGIKDFVITTGPYENKIKEVCLKYTELTFNFVHSDLFDSTNYIYSFYLTKDFLNDDFLLLHGDLVFNKHLVLDILSNPNKSIGLINKSLPKPEKDFKARVISGEIKEVGINIFDENCFAFQPFYKLSKENIVAWWNHVADFIKEGITGCYAENALNEITDKIIIKAMEYDKYFIDEIDNPDDHARVISKIRIFDFDEQEQLESLEILNKLKKPLLVVDSFLANKFTNFKTFSDFTPNPTYDDVLKGLKAFEGCSSIVSIGGGSAIDVAKAIKYYSCLNENGDFIYKNIKHVAVPTTAGTGSESTRYAVIYKNGVKQSLTHDALYPDVAVLMPDFIKTLSYYQKKCTLLDALCHSIESIWSKNATEQSKKYAQESIDLIKQNYEAYLSGDEKTIPLMQKAANLAGKAINISQTTAAHALSYKLTSLYKIPHGLAVSLTLPYLWELLINDNCTALNDENISLEEFNHIINDMNMKKFIKITECDMNILVENVNLTRLGNFPYVMSKEIIENIYDKIKLPNNAPKEKFMMEQENVYSLLKE